MPSLKLDRKTLASFLPDHQSIVAFEQIFNDVNSSIPGGIEAAAALANAAVALGNLSLAMLAQQQEQIELLSYQPAVAPVDMQEGYQPASAFGTLGQQNADAVEVTGGSIDGTTIGASSASSGAFTTLTASGAVALSPANANVVISPTGTGLVTINPATAGSIDNVDIGVTTPKSVKSTTLTATGAVALSPANANVVLSPTGTGVVTIAPATAGAMNNVAIGATTPRTVAATTITATGEVRSTQPIGGADFGMWSLAANAASRNFVLAAQSISYGQCELIISNARLGDPVAAGTVVWSGTAAGLAVTAGFGCNTKAAQAAVASGAALAAYAAGANGLAAAADMQALVNKVATMDTALKANGILS